MSIHMEHVLLYLIDLTVVLLTDLCWSRATLFSTKQILEMGLGLGFRLGLGLDLKT